MSSGDSSSFSLSSSSCCQFSLDEIKEATNNFDEKKVLGHGGEGKVYLAEIYFSRKTEKTRVAVKQLNKKSTGFEMEIRTVTNIQHPNLVSLLGYCKESDEKILIYEYMEKGSLSDYVKMDSVICLSWKQRLNICLGTAYGLQHLHKATDEFPKGIIHRDVKPANVLLDENWVAKVSDFGMFKLSNAAQINSTIITGIIKGTPGYFAPEYALYHRITRKIDVYAFGVLMFEVLCQKKPWNREGKSFYLDENEDLGVWAHENVDIKIKADISYHSLKALTDVIGGCLQPNPKKRPTMDCVVLALESALKFQEHEDERILNIGLKAPSGIVQDMFSVLQPMLTKGNRPLLTGNVNVTRDGFAAIGDLDSTDNSRWKSRKLLIDTAQGVETKEAMTETLAVKDHQIESYKPMLDDDVCRLEKIGRKLAVEGIKNVEDFFKLSDVDQSKMRKVNEEVEHALRRNAQNLSRSSSFRVQTIEPSNLQLKFTNKLSLPIFTGSKILGIDGNPLKIILMDTSGYLMISSIISHAIKIEIVALDGDFHAEDRDVWTSQEFEMNIVRESNGRRPLVIGDVNVTMRDGFAAIGDLQFTDNSSWIRSRKFRIGAKVIEGAVHGVRIKEAMTEAIVVKDLRGELYKKHYPPSLDDEVWRLEKIGKEGAFHRKLANVGIKTVQDFLKLSTVDQSKMRTILGVGMSDKMWEVTLKHGRTCILGSKMYISRGPNHTIVLNPICQVIKAVINGQTYTHRDLTSMNRAYIENFVEDAFRNWNSLQEVDGLLHNSPQITQGTNLVDDYPTHHPMAIKPYQDHQAQAFPSFEPSEVAFLSNNEQIGEAGTSARIYVPPEVPETYNNFSETSSDGDLAPTRSFIR